MEPEEVRLSGHRRPGPSGKNAKTRLFTGKFTVYSAIMQKLEKIFQFSMEIIRRQTGQQINRKTTVIQKPTIYFLLGIHRLRGSFIPNSQGQ
ncbi:hypothetical protein [Chitinophaga rhizosphaerae]|uniref:hypothetical protein n=1 Tax=Chitinophaga rhizosphaerae TaxID=1864947 RepID=UPI000F7FDB15|nr:hypothetical protein [Chitinophaga rhizosphaerae]